MKLINVFAIVAMLSIGLLAGCEKGTDITLGSDLSIYKSSILVDIGKSPVTGVAMTLSCGEVTGSVFSHYSFMKINNTAL